MASQDAQRSSGGPPEASSCSMDPRCGRGAGVASPARRATHRSLAGVTRAGYSTGVLVATALALTSLAAAPPCPAELFRIERNKNANVIVYEVVRRPDGSVDADEPVRASWIMATRGGAREDLNLLERTLAYGFDVKPASPGPGWWLALKAKKERPVRIREEAGCLAAVATIGGKEGLLRRIYVKAGEGLIPSVEYADVYGVDPRTGAALHERVVPDAPPEERKEWQGG